MIGDIPKGAPVRCRFGRHTGQEAGGLMVFQCSRCGGSFWQPHDPRLRLADRIGNQLIDAGRGEEAIRQAQQAVREVHARRGWRRRRQRRAA